jgi:hypothetical protein
MSSGVRPRASATGVGARADERDHQRHADRRDARGDGGAHARRRVLDRDRVGGVDAEGTARLQIRVRERLGARDVVARDDDLEQLGKGRHDLFGHPPHRHRHQRTADAGAAQRREQLVGSGTQRAPRSASRRVTSPVR